jgi:hypothetical protein
MNGPINFIRKHWKPFLVSALLVLCGIAWLFRPWPPYDNEKVHSSLRALHEPFRSVVTEYYLDGGSVGVRITDRDGQVLECALPVEPSGPPRYERVFIGAMWINEKGKSPIEVVEPAETRKMLIRVIDKYSPKDMNSCAALMNLRGLLRDLARPFLNALLQ